MLKKNELIDPSLKFLEEILIYLVILKKKKPVYYYECNNTLETRFRLDDPVSFREYINKIFPRKIKVLKYKNKDCELEPDEYFCVSDHNTPLHVGAAFVSIGGCKYLYLFIKNKNPMAEKLAENYIKNI